MRVYRRRLLVSAVVVVGLFVPAAGPVVAASDGGGPGSGKERLLQQLKDRPRVDSVRPNLVSGGRLSRLAAERDSGRVVIAVKVRPGANDAVAVAAVTQAARTEGGKRRQNLRQLDTVTVEVPQAAATTFTARMRGRADVAKVNMVQRRWLTLVPNDPQYPAEASYLNAVRGPAAWDVHTGDAGVRIAVVDSGVDVNHPDLQGRVAGTFNAVTGTTDVTDAVGHGTFVAGVAAATGNNLVGIAGASMGASVLGVKVADDGGAVWTDAEARGIVWAADQGARVINLSLGSPLADPVESDAIAYAVGKGVLVVASAGNDATTAPSYPAAYPQVMAIGATNTATGGRASFSNFGSWVTVAAPGVGITGTTPTAGSIFFPSLSGYDVGDGTSFSSPIVAAQAALLWSLRPAVSASDVRQAIVRSSHGFANQGLGTGQVDFRAAYDTLRPDSAPVLTQPADTATVAGVVPLSASSTAAKVRFSVNGTPVGAPVATVAGAASTTWTSWGGANGPRTVSAVDCSLGDLCNTASTPVSVTLANAAPAITSPTASQTLSGSGTFTASASGGGVAFMIDGVRRGFDAARPYTLTYPVSSLTDARHTVQARSCSVTGLQCAGPVSPLVSFTAKSLHPRITSVAPSVFSPNGDGRYDTDKVTYVLPDTQFVRFQVRNAAGVIVRGPVNIGTQSAGTKSLIWNGLLNTGGRAANGSYTLELATSRGVLRGSAVALVRVDRTAPTMSSLTGTGTTFYPYPDSYRDTFSPRFTLSERATITMTVRNRAGTLVRNVAGARAAGATSITWNGKNTAGSRVAAGTYYWTLTAQDLVGNRRASARYSVIVNARHLVTRTATLSRRGAQYYSAGGSDPSCTEASKPLSDFAPNGLWLLNACDASSDGYQIAGATYRFTLPAAHSYTSLKFTTYGNSLFSPSTLGAAFTRWATGSFTFTPEITVRGNAWRTIGTVAPTGLVSGSRVVETTLYVPNDYTSASDYDASYVRVLVTYKVLA
jgi:subtilisin family serine protease/flagellar hook assembly protein FlgD